MTDRVQIESAAGSLAGAGLSWTAESDRALRARGELPAGNYLMALETRAGTFPMETMLLDLVEWPSQRRVPCGPFDFDHTRYEMVVPTFRVFVNGEDRGLVWAEVPCPEDMQARISRAEWGFRMKQGGAVDMVLEVPETETRLRWSDVARVALRPDDRYSLRTVSSRPEPMRRPRLFLDGALLQQLRARSDSVQAELLDDLLQQLEAGADGTYTHRTVAAALAALVTDEDRWAEEAVQRTLALCERPYWGYHDTREVMGWNNDRDTGMRLFETAVVLDWLHDRLTAGQRAHVSERLGYFCELAERVTRLQVGYWYPRSPEAHGQGLWFGFACAAIALLGTDPRAQDWLDWIHGNTHDALAHAPADGISEWLVFNVQWLILTAMTLERYTGQRIKGRLPFLRGFARNIPQYLGPLFEARAHSGTLPLLLFYLAGRHGSGRTQADALALAGIKGGSAAESGKPRRFDPLTVLAYDPSVAPTRLSVQSAAFCSENGSVRCTKRKERTTFGFRCGPPLTAALHDKHSWLGQAWYGVEHSGSFSWIVDGQLLVPSSVPSYRKETRLANIINIDGGGHRQHGRWLGSRIALDKMSRIDAFSRTRRATFCRADNSNAYSDPCDVTRAIRRWVFLHGPSIVVMHDLVALHRPHVPAWNVLARQEWEQLAPDTFMTTSKDRALCVKGLLSDDMRAAGVTARTESLAFVPTYSLGMNSYKTRDWQPEVHARHSAPPEFFPLSFAPAAPVQYFELITVMGPDTDAVAGAALACEAERRRVTVPGVATVELAAHGALAASDDGTEPVGEFAVARQPRRRSS